MGTGGKMIVAVGCFLLLLRALSNKLGIAVPELGVQAWSELLPGRCGVESQHTKRVSTTKKTAIFDY